MPLPECVCRGGRGWGGGLERVPVAIGARYGRLVPQRRCLHVNNGVRRGRSGLQRLAAGRALERVTVEARGHRHRGPGGDQRSAGRRVVHLGVSLHRGRIILGESGWHNRDAGGAVDRRAVGPAANSHPQRRRAARQRLMHVSDGLHGGRFHKAPGGETDTNLGRALERRALDNRAHAVPGRLRSAQQCLMHIGERVHGGRRRRNRRAGRGRGMERIHLEGAGNLRLRPRRHPQWCLMHL